MTPGSLSFGLSKLACSYRVRMLDSLRREQRSVRNKSKLATGIRLRTNFPFGRSRLAVHPRAWLSPTLAGFHLRNVLTCAVNVVCSRRIRSGRLQE